MADIPTHVRDTARRVNIPQNLEGAFNRLVGDNTIVDLCEKLLKAVYKLYKIHPPRTDWQDARHVWAMGGDDDRGTLLLMDAIMACFSGMKDQARNLEIEEVLHVPDDGYQSWRRCCGLLRAYVDGRDGGDERLQREARQSDRGNRERDMAECLHFMRLYSGQDFHA
ncbi:uncharacterized protein DNG_08755 [Cephalotrichum gorgonifer]|uniref:Uncharacterized protein n=1 Tax=Cephalotrichum gorgonifer TaxID=2041049 RepID=A0AAE8N467_9PEZI|nr:uncharacterized protein DNG_08755 [Cephalotrichum gorgonifer]